MFRSDRRFAPVLAAWLVLSAVTQLPYLKATLDPPRGRAFAGFFQYLVDQYVYFSYVTQAENGRFFFDNSLVLDAHPRCLINLEWWAAGRLSWLLGRRPFLAWRIVGALAAFALLAAAERWLAWGGLPPRHRLSALLFVGLGAGAGGLAARLGLVPEHDALDLWAALYPVVEMLSTPHAVAGTALLAWALYAFQRARTLRQQVVAIGVGTALGLVRPYDFFILGAAHLLAVALVEPPGRWPSRLWPLAGLLPTLVYLVWVFYGVPWFATFQAGIDAPSPRAFALALLPPLLLVGGTWRWRGPLTSREAAAPLLAWIAVVAAVLVLRPVDFALQFAAGVGLPVLLLAALALGRFSARVAALAVLAFATTGACLLERMFEPTPEWHVRPERLQAAAALRETCLPGEVAFVPRDIGLYVLGLTACKPYVSVRAAPGYDERAARLERFYASADPEERAAILASVSAAHLVLPAPAGEPFLEPPAELRLAAIVGQDGRTLRVYSRR